VQQQKVQKVQKFYLVFLNFSARYPRFYQMLSINSIAQIKSFSKLVEKYFKILMCETENKRKKVNFSIYDLDPKVYGLDLTGFRGFGQGQRFYQKCLLIFESLFLDFSGSFYFFHFSAVYPWFIGISKLL